MKWMPRESNTGAKKGSTGGAGQLLLVIEKSSGLIGAQLERALREAIRAGRLAPGERLPASRALAADLAVSRRVVVGAYEQLVAEGWCVSRHGSGTFAAEDGAAGSGRAASQPPRPRPADVVPGQGAQSAGLPLPYDFFAGAPDLASFPRAAWLRALRDALRVAPDVALHYPDPAGVPELRAQLAARLGRARGVLTAAPAVVVTSGARQGLAVLGRALVAGGAKRIAVEWPTVTPHVDVLIATGLDVVRIPVGADGIDVSALAESDADAVVVTPAHQMPLGVARAPERRAALIDWVAIGERLVIEDDYDAEFRYDRRPIGALQALDPDRVAYLGSASKTLAPGLRLGWLALPGRLVSSVTQQKNLDDAGTPVLEQLALARMIESGAFDRHLRGARRRYSARRTALTAALTREIPGTKLQGMAAGLHAVARLTERVDASRLDGAARQRGVGVYPLADEDGSTDSIVLGYANLSEPAIAEGIKRLAAALTEARNGG